MTIQTAIDELYTCVSGLETVFEVCANADMTTQPQPNCIMNLAKIILTRAENLIADLQFTCEQKNIADNECLKA